MPVFLLIGIFLYFPLYTLFGGWDDNTLTEFEKVIQMSGPSKKLLIFLYKYQKKIAKFSPLHNRYPIASEAAMREARELYIMKLENN